MAQFCREFRELLTLEWSLTSRTDVLAALGCTVGV